MGVIVHVLQRECGDYYCGCGGGHIIGVFSDPTDVEPHNRGFGDTVTVVEVGVPKALGEWS